MSTSEIKTVTVNIMGREFKIGCPQDNINELHQAAAYLNNKMQEVQRGDRYIPIDHVAITAALNISHELLAKKQYTQSHTDDINKLNERLLNLRHKVEKICS